MSTTTTKNLKKASGVLMPRVEKTAAQMKQKMERAGVTEYKTVKVLVPKSFSEADDVLTIGLNGEMFYFLRGTSVNMPEPLADILEKAGVM